MIRKGVVLLFACLMAVSAFAPFVAGTPTAAPAASTGDAVGVSPGQTERIDPAPVDPSLQDANGTVEVVVRAEEFEVPDASTAASGSVVEELKEHANASQRPIVEWARSTDGVDVVNRFWLANAVLLELDTAAVDVEQVAAQDGVTSVHENFEVNVPEPVAVNASAADTTYGLDQINATEVWETYGTMGAGAKVAVLDTGVDASHPDIDLYTENASDPTYPGGWAEFNDSGGMVEGSTPHDSQYHGTHTSGTVAGGNASGEYVGVAPNADLMHGLVLPGGSGGFAQIIAGMEWAVAEDADVISMSLGTEDYSPQLIEPVRNAYEAGTAVVAAAGNCNEGCSGSPGNVYDSFAIGASNADGDIASFSSGEVVDTDADWGSDAPSEWPSEYVVPDVSAPGVNVKSTEPDNSYQQLSGTSMATPHVAGTMALLLAASGGTATPEELQTALEETAWKPAGEPDEPDVRYGHGIVDAAAAAEQVAVDTGVTGTVTDAESGDAIPGVTVESGDGFRSTTGADGSYDLRLGPGSHAVTADAFGYAAETANVTVPTDGTVERNFSLSPEFAVEVTDDQRDQILGGDSVTATLRVAHADELTVEQVGNLSAADATLLVDGTEYAFGEAVPLDGRYGTVNVTVATADGASGTVELRHTVSGGDGSVERTTGPTTVYAEGDRIGVVAVPGDDHAAAFADMLTDRSVTYQTEVITPGTAVEDAGEYDALVAHSLGSDPSNLETARELLDATTSAGVGLVVLDQQGGGADAISALSEARGYPQAVDYPSSFLVGSPSYYADIRNGSHPLWDGVSFDNITTAPPDFIRADVTEFTTVHWAGFDGTTRAVAGQYLLPAGPSIGTDVPRGVTLFGSHGYTGSVGPGDYTDKANRAVGNAVELALDADESPLRLTSGTPARVDPGSTVEATFDVENLTKVKTELTDRSTIDAGDLTLRHGSSETAFGEWRTYDGLDDDAFGVSVDVAAGVAGTVELNHTFVVESGGETRTFTVTTRRTSVYEPPLEVPTDVDSIQAAVDMAVPNAEIVVEDGTYTEQVVVPAAQPSYGITVRGADGATPTVKAPADLGEDEGVIEIQSKQVTVENLHVQGPEGEDATYGVLSGVHGLSIPTHGTTVRDVSVDDADRGVGVGGQSIGSDARDATISNVRVTNASVGVLLGTPVGHTFITDASDATVTDSYLEASDGGVVASGRQIQDVEIRNNTVVGADTGVYQDGSEHLHVAGNTLEGVDRGIYAYEGAYYGTYEDNRILDAEVGVDLEGTYFGGYHGQAILNNTVEADVGVRLNDFRELLAPGTVQVRFNDLSGTDVAVESTRDPDDLSTVDARLNWLGERGTGDVTVEQSRDEVVYDPFLVEPPANVDQDDPRAFGTGLAMEAGGAYAVGSPGPLAGNVTDVFGADFEGAVYGYDAAAQQWNLLDGDDELGALDGLYVSPDENATATLSFHHDADAPSGPAETTLREGWNFVGATHRTGAETAFGNGTAAPALALGIFEQPNSSLAPGEGGLDGRHVFAGNGSGSTVGPFDAAFVYAESGGSHVGRMPANPSLSTFYDALNVSSQVDGAAAATGADVEDDRLSTAISESEYRDRLLAVATAAVQRGDLGDEPVQATVARANSAVHRVASLHDHGLDDDELDAVVRRAVERATGEDLAALYEDAEPVDEQARRELGFPTTDAEPTATNTTAAPSAGASAAGAGADAASASATNDSAEYQVAFVDAMIPAWNAGERMVEYLRQEADLNESFNVTPVHATEFFDDLNASLDEYDVVVANNLGTAHADVPDAKIEQFLEYAERPDLGVVYLGNKDDSPPNAVHELETLRDDPSQVTGEVDWGAEQVYYEVTQDHPVFEGIAEPGEKVQVLDEPWTARYSYFDGYDGETVAALGTDEGGTLGGGVAVDDIRNEVLLSSSAFNGFVIEWDFTSEAYQLMANAIEEVEPFEPVVLAENAPVHAEPGEAVSGALKVSRMERVKVELADDSTVAADDVSLTVNGSTASLGEWRSFDEPVSAESFPVAATVDDGVAGRVVLNVTVESAFSDDPVTLTVGPTAVYEPPLTAGEDVPTVQEAVDLAPSDGRTVHVADGTYEEQVTVTTPDLTLRAADGADPTVAATDGPAVTVAAENVTVRGLDVAASSDHDGVVVDGVANATVAGVGVADAGTGVRVTGATDATVENVSATDAGTGVAVENATAATVTGGTLAGVDTGVAARGAATTASVTDVTVDGGTGVSLADVDPSAVTVRFNDLSATDVGVDSDLDDRFDARLNYLGHGTADTAIEGDVAYEPFLTEPPARVDHDRPVAIGIELLVDAGERTAIGVPGPTNLTAGELFSDDFEGTVYDYDAGPGKSWMAMDDDDELDALEGLRVDAETDGHAVIEFREPGPSAPGSAELEHGWNFVAPPAYADAETAFQVGSADVWKVRDKFAAPGDQPGPAGEFNGSYVFGSDKPTPDVSAFQGYFVQVDNGGAGTVPSYLHSDVTMTDLYELVGLDAEEFDDDEDAEADDDRSNVASPTGVAPARAATAG